MLTRRMYFAGLLSFLATGTVIAWYTITVGFVRFYRLEGTLLKFTDCVIPNPLTTPCFLGAIAFLVALLWAVSLANTPMPSTAPGYEHLWWFLLAATVFGWTNVAFEFWTWQQSSTGVLMTCTAESVASPFQSPCLYGSAMFLAAWVTVGLRMRLLASLLGETWDSRGVARPSATVQCVIESAIHPRLARLVIVAWFDGLAEDMSVVTSKSGDLLFETDVCLAHQLTVAAIPQIIAMPQRSRHATARCLNRVFADGLGIAWRQFAVPEDNLPGAIISHLHQPEAIHEPSSTARTVTPQAGLVPSTASESGEALPATRLSTP